VHFDAAVHITAHVGKQIPIRNIMLLGCGQDELGIEHVVDKVELVFIVIIETFAVYMAEVANIVHAN